jgi:hypothetical protein
MLKLALLVENKILKLLPDQLAIAFYERIDNSKHFLAAFALFSEKDNECGYKVLLSFSPLFDEENLNAEFHYETLYEILQFFGKTFPTSAASLVTTAQSTKALPKMQILFIWMRKQQISISKCRN